MLRSITFFLICLIIPSVCSAQTFHVRASSFVPQSDETVFNGMFLTDGNHTTGWIEKGEGSGAGEWVQFFFPAQVIIDSVRIRNGIGAGDEFSKVNRVKDVSLSFSGGQRQEFTLLDSELLQSPVIRKFPTTSLGLNIRSVYAADGVQEAGISEVEIKYHRLTPEDLAAVTTSGNELPNGADLGEADSSKPRKMTAKEKKVLYEKMSDLEKKQAVLDELKVFFDRFYTSFVTINEEYPRMYTADNFLRESAMFESFRSMLVQRKVLDKYKEAVVSTSGLRYNIRTLTPSEVELWVKGDYTVIFDMKSNQINENALYHLKKEYGEWKVKNKLEY